MKYKNYLVHNTRGFQLSRGHIFEEGENLAIVRLASSPLEFKGEYSIIDIPSGLYVVHAKSKKKLLEKWNEKKEYSNIIDLIKRAREGSKYLDRVLELNNEKKIWRESGYEVA